MTIDLQFEDNAAVCAALASDGYPVSGYEKVLKSSSENFDAVKEVTTVSMPETVK
ncbi:MAG: hypothetical protein ACLTOM_06960 [Roseburia sp.]